MQDMQRKLPLKKKAVSHMFGFIKTPQLKTI
jgi:hypothetical protein